MTYKCFKFTIANKVAHLIFNRPTALNTMQPVFWRELMEIVSALQRMASARVLVISSTGKNFTAGMASDVFNNGDGVGLDDRTAVSRANVAPQLEEMQRAFTAIEQLRMPVIAAIQGGCIGGGVDLVSACDKNEIVVVGFDRRIDEGFLADLLNFLVSSRIRCRFQFDFEVFPFSYVNDL